MIRVWREFNSILIYAPCILEQPGDLSLLILVSSCRLENLSKDFYLPNIHNLLFQHDTRSSYLLLISVKEE